MTGKYPARINLTDWLVGRRWPKDSPISPVDWRHEMPLEEIKPLFEDAIDNAIKHERDPINQIRSRVFKATENMRLRQALRLNTAYLGQRPNDQIAQSSQLDLLADLNRGLKASQKS